jgi:hypothetical protein
VLAKDWEKELWKRKLEDQDAHVLKQRMRI